MAASEGEPAHDATHSSATDAADVKAGRDEPEVGPGRRGEEGEGGEAPGAAGSPQIGGTPAKDSASASPVDSCSVELERSPHVDPPGFVGNGVPGEEAGEGVPTPSAGGMQEEDEAFSQQLDQQLRIENAMREQAEAKSIESANFRIADLTRNPALAHKAWLELHGDAEEEEPEGAEGERTSEHLKENWEVATSKCVGELERDRAIVKAMEADADAESKLNGELHHLLVARLKAGRHALDAMHKFVHNLISAETSAASAYACCKRILHSSSSDAALMQQLTIATVALPAAVADAARVRANALAGPSTALAAAASRFRDSADTIARGMRGVHGMMAQRRRLLKDTMGRHEGACVDIDQRENQQRRGSMNVSPPTDPWLTQAALVHAEIELIEAQSAERGLVCEAYEQVEKLERERIRCWQDLTNALVTVYGGMQLPWASTGAANGAGAAENEALEKPECLGPVQALQGLLQSVQWNALCVPLAAAAESGRSNAKQMQQQGADTARMLAHDLFSSPEIIRQGHLERFDPESESWVSSYCVLTRCGVMHVCRAATAEAALPLDSLILMHYEFDGVTGSVFSVTRPRGAVSWFGGGPKRRSFRGETPEAAIEWIVDVKEMMFHWSGRGEALAAQTPRTPWRVAKQ